MRYCSNMQPTLNTIRKLAIGSCLLLLSGSASNAGQPVNMRDETAVEAIRRGLTALAFDLYGQLNDGTGNLVFSPISIALSISSTYAGARGNTEEQIAEVLHNKLGQERYHAAFGSLRSEINSAGRKARIRLSAAKCFLGQKGLPFKQDFLALIKNAYGYELHQGDFAGPDSEVLRTRLNAWVARKTNNRVADLIPRGALNPDTRLVKLNAIYMKADWSDAFEKDMTRNEGFQVDAATRVKVPTMRKVTGCRYGDSDALQIIELGYGGGQIAMVIVLPRAPNTLPDIETMLSPANVEEWLGLLSRPRRYDVELHIPRFRIEGGANLQGVLSELGMPDVYDPDRADLTGIAVAQPPLFLDMTLHRAGIIVDEEGTEAWAVTGDFIAIGFDDEPKRPRRLFRADHPFLFFIRDRGTGVILFMGRVQDPR